VRVGARLSPGVKVQSAPGVIIELARTGVLGAKPPQLEGLLAAYI